MKLLPVMLFACMVLLVASAASAQERDNPRDDPSTATFDEAYPELGENNIFVRDRRPPPPPVVREERPPPPPPAPETKWMLTGVVFEQGVFRAYFENLETGEVHGLTAGSVVAEGLIGELFIDSVSYLSDGQITWVDIGDDLTGNPAEFSRSGQDDDRSSAGESASGSEDGDDESEGAAADEGGDDGELSIEERMRRRRAQEQGRN